MVKLPSYLKIRSDFMATKTEENRGTKKETFMQGVVTLIFSQVLIKL